MEPWKISIETWGSSSREPWFHEELSSIAHANMTFMDESGSGHSMCHTTDN
jgi:hypothetical protein